MNSKDYAVAEQIIKVLKDNGVEDIDDVLELVTHMHWE